MGKAYRIAPMLAAVSLAMGLAGCGAPLDLSGAEQSMASIMPSERPADRALTALAHGDTGNAENYALTALRKTPKDPTALMVAGLVYQSTGRYVLARQYYDVILTNNIAATLMVPGDNGIMQPRSVLDIAKANLETIDKITGRKTAHSMADSGRAPGVDFVQAPVNDAETNVAGRFRALKRLLDEDLITPDEYASRRRANIGALLPLTAPPPAQGLERPIPPDSQIVQRLKALKVAVEARELAPREQTEERQIILDALLPAQPRAVSLPPLPPRDMLEAAQAVGRAERMRAAGLISSEEMTHEKVALDMVLDGPTPGKPVEGTATGLRYGSLPAAGSTAVPVAVQALAAKALGWGVSVGLAKSEAAAATTWDRVKAKFPEDLGPLQLAAKKVDLREKGARWRVVAGPLDSQEAAVKLCKTLKLHRQSCDPAPFDK